MKVCKRCPATPFFILRASVFSIWMWQRGERNILQCAIADNEQALRLQTAGDRCKQHAAQLCRSLGILFFGLVQSLPALLQRFILWPLVARVQKFANTSSDFFYLRSWRQLKQVDAAGRHRPQKTARVS